MAAVLSRRLGKRSLLGTRVAAPDPAGSQIPEFSPHDHGANPEFPDPGFLNSGSPNPGFPNPGSLRQLHGQQVLVTSLDEQIPGFPACWRVQDTLQAPSLPSSSIPERSVSSNIDVPKRRPDAAVEMDEMMAAMVLTSLSCSPALQSPPSASLAAVGDPWRDSGDVSDSGSSTTSGHWSSGGGHWSSAGSATASPPHCPGSVTASPPHCGGSVTSSPPHCGGSVTSSPPHCGGSVTSSPPHHGGSVTLSPPHRGGSVTSSPPHRGGSVTSSPPHRGGSATPSPLTDDGFDTDPEPSPPEEPAPRRRKNPSRLMFKCLWPGCGKVLRSGVGIKRHVRTQHLGDGSVWEQREREEDFYYTEVQAREEPPAELPPPAVPSVTSVTNVASVTNVTGATCSAPIVIQPSPCQPGLSHSAPGSFWHIQADHAYQALPSIQIPVSPHIFTSISWAAATPTLPSLSPSLSPVRSRSLSLSEPQAPPLLHPQLLVASPPRVPLTTSIQKHFS
ncbi:PREDICTED: zinc finger protein 395 [Sturnus vulgaris]|uniref:zinc finger protein 395 n=1 Tax=Sturnus vulgaris TaxID=9172 RepID=UPI00071A4E02|nr:PREDICTED: zinc finger protein 395 [Sturnus vulgaris]